MNIIFSKILIRNFILHVIILLAVYLIYGMPGTKFYFSLAVTILAITALEYDRYERREIEQGITKGDPNQSKVKFENTIETTKKEAEIIKEIIEYDKYLGQVVFNGEIIVKQKWKGIIMMSKSEILKVEDNADLVKYSLKTQPYFSWIKLDHYANLSCYRALKSMISGTQQQIIIA